MVSLVYHCPAWKFIACRALGRLWPGVYYSRLAPGRLRDVPGISRLPRGWARVRVHQCGLCASDLPMLRLDLSPSVAPSAIYDAAERSVLGHELVGEVIEAGTDCPLEVGRRVISRSAGFRNCHNLGVSLCRCCQEGEYALCLNQDAPAPSFEPIRSGGFSVEYVEHHANLLAVPDDLSDDQAALVEPLACSLRAVLKAADREVAGRNALVIGAGIQGLGTVHWLKRLYPNLHVILLARYPFQRELGMKLGADAVLNGDVTPATLADRLGTRLIKGVGDNQLLADGFDTVIDAVGSRATFNRALRWTRPGGRVVLLGAHLRRERLDYSPIWFREIDVRGVYAHGLEQFGGRGVQTMQLVMDLMRSGGGPPVNLATHHLPLADYRRAIDLMTHKAASGAVKIMLEPEPSARASN